MRPCQIYIAPVPEKIIKHLPADLQKKVRNALRQIGCDKKSGTSLGTPDDHHLYKAGRFRILYRRQNGSVWIEALTLDPAPSLSLPGRKRTL